MGVAEIKLEAVLDLYNIGELQEKFTEALAEDEVVIIAEEVSRIKTPAAQLIVAFGREVAQRGKVFKVRNPSGAFGRVFGLLGCGGLLEEWGEKNE